MIFLSPEYLWPWVREPPAALPGLVPFERSGARSYTPSQPVAREFSPFPGGWKRDVTPSRGVI